MNRRNYNMPNGYLPPNYNQGYNRQSYVANNYQPGYHNPTPRKKSGCKLGQDKKQRPCITGWNKSKQRGFISFVAVPCNNAKTKSANSDKWVATVQFPDGKKTFTAFYNVNSKKLTIPDLQMVANPAKNYFGTFVKRK